jgi:hypothetical protein
MKNTKKNHYISLSSESPSLPRMRKDYLNQHSKFIHASWLLKEDIDREVELEDRKYTIFGLWEVHNGRYTILLKPVDGGAFLIADSKQVAIGLGYSRMRNLVTGVEYATDTFSSKGKFFVEERPVEDKTSVDDEDNDWEDSSEEEDFIDPLVKALQDDLIDEGDSSAI